MTNKTELKPETTIRPDIAQFITLDYIALELRRIRTLLKSMQATGEKNKTYSLTTAVFRLKAIPSWIAFTLVNDGPDDILLNVTRTTDPDPTDTAVIHKDEVYKYDATYPIIDEVRLRTVSSTASVRVFGQEGAA